MMSGPPSRFDRSLRTTAVVAAMLVWPLARQIADLDAAPELRPDERAAALVRQVQAAQGLYRSVHGYYDRLECLVQDACVPLVSYPPSYLAPDATRPTAHGYRFRLHEGARVQASDSEPISPTGMIDFAFTAVPIDRSMNSPSFCGDASGRVFSRSDGRLPRIRSGQCVDTERPLE
jgi:hypothetical protein